jgi:PAS domain S-box-containing protein
LRELEKKFHAVAHSANDAIISSDSLGNTVFWNYAAQKMFGYTPEEIIGQPLTVLMPERYRGPHEERMKLHTSTGESKVLGQTVELTGLRKDGSEFPLELSLAMWKAGQEVFYTGIIRDISKRKAAQEALLKARDELEQRVEERTARLAKTMEQLKSELHERRQAENALNVAHKNLEEKAAALEEVNEELSQYVHIASHDLKSMLQGIHIYADLLNEDLETILDGDQKEYLQGLTRTVGRSEQLADDLLELSQVGRGSMSVKAVNTAMLFRELIASLDLSSDVKVSMDNNLPTINTDPNLLEHAFRNLITNAIKFNDAERKHVEIGWNPVGEDSYGLFVRDNGIGIEVRFHEQVFDVFKRLHAHRKYEGTGLGLAIVKKAVAKLNGSVRIESKVGKGSTFFVTLPRSQTTS